MYWEANPKQQDTILLIHGLKGEHSGLEAVAATFSGHLIIMPDLPGFGESDPLTTVHSIENYALVIERLAQALDLQTYQLIGHSYGGVIALVYAALFGWRLSAVALAMPALPGKSLSRRLATLELEIGCRLPYSWQWAWFYAPLKDALGYAMMTQSRSYRQRLAIFLSKLAWPLQTEPRAISDALRSFNNLAIGPYVAKIKLPVLIVGGERDFIATEQSLRGLSQAMPSSTLILLPKTGHVANLDYPALLGSILKQYLARYDEKKVDGSDQRTVISNLVTSKM